jgi:hypothetical protein
VFLSAFLRGSRSSLGCNQGFRWCR